MNVRKLKKNDFIIFTYEDHLYSGVFDRAEGDDLYIEGDPDPFEIDDICNLTVQKLHPIANRRKHYDVIVAWAEGADVQCMHCAEGSWFDTKNPNFGNPCLSFRIKPEEDAEKVQLKRDIEKLELHLKNLKERL